MNEREYFRRVKFSDELKETIRPIFEFFEPFVDNEKENHYSDNNEIEHINKDDYDKKQIEEYYEMLRTKEILESVNRLKKEVLKIRKNPIIRKLVNSLHTNIFQFMTESRYRTKIKWKKLLVSYKNATRVFFQDPKILQRLQSDPDESPYNLILAIGLVNIEEDNIKVKDEIDEIDEIYNKNVPKNDVVFPVYGCSTNILKALLDSFPKIKILHLAGHTKKRKNGEVCLSLVDSILTFNKFSHWINKHNFQFSFYNCCSSDQFVTNTTNINSKKIILHRDEVNSMVAFNYSKNIYLSLSAGKTYDEAWNIAKINTNEKPLKYVFK